MDELSRDVPERERGLRLRGGAAPVAIGPARFPTGGAGRGLVRGGFVPRPTGVVACPVRAVRGDRRPDAR